MAVCFSPHSHSVLCVLGTTVPLNYYDPWPDEISLFLSNLPTPLLCVVILFSQRPSAENINKSWFKFREEQLKGNFHTLKGS